MAQLQKQQPRADDADLEAAQAAAYWRKLQSSLIVAMRLDGHPPEAACPAGSSFEPGSVSCLAKKDEGRRHCR